MLVIHVWICHNESSRDIYYNWIYAQVCTDMEYDKW